VRPVAHFPKFAARIVGLETVIMMTTFLLCGNEGSAARYVEEMTGPPHEVDLPPLKAPVTDAMAARRLREIEDPADRVKVWNGPTARLAESWQASRAVEEMEAVEEKSGTIVPLSPASERRSRPA
jgi:hypothetical protein